MLGGILAFVAVAFTLTIGMLNFLNFTIPALFMIAGMVTWALSSSGSNLLGWSWHWDENHTIVEHRGHPTTEEFRKFGRGYLRNLGS